MIPKRVIAIAGAMALAACAPRVTWVRADASPSDFNRDSARCEYEIASSTANYGSSMPVPWSFGASIGQGIGLGIGKGLEQAKLYALCMRANGYTAVAANAPLEQTPIVWPLQPRPPQPEYADNAPPQVTIAQPAMPPGGLKGESRYLLTAEALAKAHGCIPPATTMTAKGMGLESFAVNCPSGKAYSITAKRVTASSHGKSGLAHPSPLRRAFSLPIAKELGTPIDTNVRGA
jgi:hypothetical protein